MRIPITFYKAGPTDFVIKYVAGNRRATGKGCIFFVGPRTTLVSVPTTIQTIPFAFTELTNDGQQIMVQGELQARLLIDEVVTRRDFSIDPWTGSYESDDPEKVSEEASHALQIFVRREALKRNLKEILIAAAELESTVFEAIKADTQSFTGLGIEVINLFITSVAPANPDLTRALQAEAREKMLAAADKAVADRREAAATSDRRLKEYEAETARTLEERRADLVKVRNTNLLAEAVADAEAIDKRLAPYRDMDAGTLLALGVKEIAASGRVAQFSITPDLLAAVSAATKKDGAGRGE